MTLRRLLAAAPRPGPLGWCRLVALRVELEVVASGESASRVDSRVPADRKKLPVPS